LFFFNPEHKTYKPVKYLEMPGGIFNILGKIIAFIVFDRM
jgi:hypothetical protein